VIVFTTLQAESVAQVLEFYRLRWQIELAFKRMKTLAQLGHLPRACFINRFGLKSVTYV